MVYENDMFCPSSVRLSVSAWFLLSSLNRFLMDFIQILSIHVPGISGVSGLGLLMGKFRQSARHTSMFSFLDDN